MVSSEELSSLRTKPWSPARIWHAVKRIPTVPGAENLLAIGPALLLVGVPPLSVALIALAIIACSSVMVTGVNGNESSTDSGLLVFGVVISVLGFTTGLGLSLVGLTVVSFAAIAGVIRVVVKAGSTPDALNAERGPVAERESDKHLVIGFPILLTLLGWQSLAFYSLALLFAQLVHRTSVRVLANTLRSALLALGLVASYVFGQRMEGQFWLSVDQLFRTTIAQGLSRWGYTDFSGAVGSTLRYQWLGEASAGVIARYSFASAADGVSKIAPALGLLISLVAMRRLGRQLGFGPKSALAGALTTGLLCREFELSTVGAVWGFGLFLMGLTLLNQLVLPNSATELGKWVSWLGVITLTPLITLTQSTLGLHFALTTIFVLIICALWRKEFKPLVLLAIPLQIGTIFLLRRTLLENSLSSVFSPSLSLQNILQFRGLSIYVGENRLYVAGVSVLFLMLLSQSGAGLILLKFSKVRRQALLTLLFAPGMSSILLSNAFSILGVEAQQSRFLSPIVVILTLLSCLLVSEQIGEVVLDTRVDVRPRLPLLTLSLIIGAGSYANYRVFESEWSRDRVIGVALIIVTGQSLLTLVLFLRNRVRTSSHILMLVLSVAGLVFLSHGRNIAPLVESHSTSSYSARVEEFVGDVNTQACLTEIRRETPRNTVIATNWFRISPPSREPKNFLVSAWTERRVFIDGPLYISVWTGGLTNHSERVDDWIESRTDASDNFAESATKESYEALRAERVEYFVLSTYEPTARSWEPYADVVFERDTCKILKLRT